MNLRIPKASRKSFIAFLTVSLTLHLLVCRIPVSSHITHDEEAQVLQISLVSVAAPSVLGNSNEDKIKTEQSKKTSEIQTMTGKAYLPQKVSDESKTKSIITSNDTGKNSVTVIKTLSESDYIQTVAPVYPARAIDKGFEGTVIIKALISDKGDAKNVDLVSSSGHQILDKSALDAVAQWKFKKSALNMANEEMWVQVPVKFIIR